MGEVVQGRLFDRPSAQPIVLPVRPVLASWDASTSPSQKRLVTYLETVRSLVDLGGGSGLVLELVVGLPEEVSLDAGGHDLDNYLYPVAASLGPARFDAVFASKRHAADSTIAVAAASFASVSPGAPNLDVVTTASSATRAWKEQINRACQAISPTPLPPGGVDLVVRFTVHSRRNWATLWKPAIDALGPVLGIPDPRQPFRPNDDRVTTLSLQRMVDDALRHQVHLEMWWRTNPQRSTR